MTYRLCFSLHICLTAQWQGDCRDTHEGVSGKGEQREARHMGAGRGGGHHFHFSFVFSFKKKKGRGVISWKAREQTPEQYVSSRGGW